jgi:hypothetical protein
MLELVKKSVSCISEGSPEKHNQFYIIYLSIIYQSSIIYLFGFIDLYNDGG